MVAQRTAIAACMLLAITAGAEAAGEGLLPVSALMDGIPRLPHYSQAPARPVQATPQEDAWVRERASHVFISAVVPADEFAEGADAEGHALPGTSRGNSLSSCPAHAVLCFHTHPLQDVGNNVRLEQKIFQVWRLTFGTLDYQPVLNGMPNYMLNYRRQLQVLEYTPARGYYVRDLGVVAYAGPAVN